MTQFDNTYHHTRKRLIFGSIAISLLLDFMPLPFSHWLPEFTALILIFWLLHRPQNIGISMAFAIGVLLDIGSGSPLGLHALAFVLAAYLVQRQQRQMLVYTFGLQSLAVFGVLMLIQLTIAMVYWLDAQQFNNWGLFISPFIGAFLWPLLNNMMLALTSIRRRS